jgi:hypothetical protein
LAVKKKTGEASGTKKKRKDELDDPFSVEVIKCFAMNSEKKEAMELFCSKELQRHHQAMEALAVWDQEFRELQGEFDFKVKRLAQFHGLKEKFDVEFIKAVFPEMKAFIDTESLIQKG